MTQRTPQHLFTASMTVAAALAVTGAARGQDRFITEPVMVDYQHLIACTVCEILADQIIEALHDIEKKVARRN